MHQPHPSDDEASELKKIGIVGLDDVLLGGIPKGNIVLIEGTPGSGKTTLTLEFMYRGAAEMSEPGVLISFELSPNKLIRDAKGFGWDFRKLEAENKLKLIYTSPAVLLQELQAPDGVITSQIRAMKAKRVAIDGLTPLRLFSEAATGKPFRENLHMLVEVLQRHGLTALLTNEVNSAQAYASHEQFVCDTVISLKQIAKNRSQIRSLEVTKSRGQDYMSGAHTLRIEAGHGVRVYPRAYAKSHFPRSQPSSETRSSVGNKEVDAMLGGGVYDGSVTLIVGISGTGKTVGGLQFLVEGAKQGKRGLLITLDENPAQIRRNARTMKIGLEEQIDTEMVLIHYSSPLELEMDVHFHEVKKLVEEHNIERIVVDSIAAYETCSPKEFRDFLFAMATYFKDRLVTAFFNYESPELLGISQISEDLKASNAVDNIILLNYVEVSTSLRRAITVPKSRGSVPSTTTREYVIAEGGINLIKEDQTQEFPPVPQLPLSSYYGVLARSPMHKSPHMEEKIARGEGLPKSSEAHLSSPQSGRTN